MTGYYKNDVRKRYLTGCSTHAELVHIAAALEQKGWPEADIRGLLGDNLVRALAKIWGN
jgi:microsomal dipeptidase-like Zn-dependent dipeptidase